MLFDEERRKKPEDGGNVLFQALAKMFFLTSKSCSWQSSVKCTSGKGNDIYGVILLKVD